MSSISTALVNLEANKSNMEPGNPNDRAGKGTSAAAGQPLTKSTTRESVNSNDSAGGIASLVNSAKGIFGKRKASVAAADSSTPPIPSDGSPIRANATLPPKASPPLAMRRSPAPNTIALPPAGVSPELYASSGQPFHAVSSIIKLTRSCHQATPIHTSLAQALLQVRLPQPQGHLLACLCQLQPLKHDSRRCRD